MAAKDRADLMIGFLESNKLDVYVGVTSAFHNFLDPDPVISLAGFRPLGPCAVLVRRTGEVTLVVTPAWDVDRARDQCGAAAVVCCDDLVQGIEAELGKLKGAAPRFGLSIMEAVPFVLDQKIRSLFVPDAIDASELLRQAAAVKTGDELDDAWRATCVAEAGYRHLLDIVRPGMPECEVAAEILCFMKSRGSHDNFLLMSAAQHNLSVRAPSQRILQAGDILLAEITPGVNSQFSQICRTVVLGAPSEMLSARFALLQQAMTVGMAAAVPGATVSSVASAIDRTISEAGFADYCKPPYMRVRGHGLGNISSAPGDIVGRNQRILERGMVFVMHPNQYFPDVGYLLCGEPVVITEHGAVALSTRAAELDHLAGTEEIE